METRREKQPLSSQRCCLRHASSAHASNLVLLCSQLVLQLMMHVVCLALDMSGTKHTAEGDVIAKKTGWSASIYIATSSAVE